MHSDHTHKATGHTHRFPIGQPLPRGGAVHSDHNHKATGHTHQFPIGQSLHRGGAVHSDHNHKATGHTHQFPIGQSLHRGGATHSGHTHKATDHTHQFPIGQSLHRGMAMRSDPAHNSLATPTSSPLLSRLAGVSARDGGGLPLLEAFGVPPGRDPEAAAAAAELRGLGAALGGFRCVRSPRFPQQYSQYAARQELLQQLEELQFQLSDQSLLLLPEYHQRLEVLEELGYVSGGAVALGGRVAALLSTEQLVLTELLLVALGGRVAALLSTEQLVLEELGYVSGGAVALGGRVAALLSTEQLVLEELGYVSGGAVALGGRVAALLSTEQLVLTELLLGNVLAPLRPEESVALLSCLVTPGRGEPLPEGLTPALTQESVALLSCLVTPGRGEPLPEGLTPALTQALERLRAVAARVARLEQQRGLGPGPDDFVAQFGFSLVQVVYEWARGMPFAEIARLAPVQEGSVVRAIQRLEELLRELRQAARAVGDPAMAAKMEAAAAMIKRDIVFAASLYTQ
ncbi:uncharacterized protein RBU47_014736 [Passerculus sandwichensis]